MPPTVARPFEGPLTGQIPEIWADELRAFLTTLEAEGKAVGTRRLYRVYLEQLGRFLSSQGMPTEPHLVTREHVEHWIISVRDAHPGSPTVRSAFASARRFFSWLLEEGEIKEHPMARMKRPPILEKSVPVISDELVRRLLAACNGTDFAARRDTAILRLLIDTPLRRTELGRLLVSDLDLPTRTVVVTVKGGRQRSVPFGVKSAQALERYLRLRREQSYADLPQLWLTREGAMSVQGPYLVLRRRAAAAGIAQRVHTHLFRHLFAHSWLSAGNQEEALMQLGGWRSREVMRRYGQSVADQRAVEAYRRNNPGDRF